MKGIRNINSAWGLALILPLLLVAPPVASQTAPGPGDGQPMSSVGEQELQSFVVAYLDVQQLQAEIQESTDARVEQSDLSTERFYEIHQLAQQEESSNALTGVESPELAEYRTVLEDVIEIQQEMQSEMVGAVQEEGLTVERFNEIMVGIREDQDLAGRAEEVLEETIAEREDEDAVR